MAVQISVLFWLCAFFEKDWPKGLMLFANNGNLHLMRGHPEDGGKSLATFTIPSDGGDTFIE